MMMTRLVASCLLATCAITLHSCASVSEDVPQSTRTVELEVLELSIDIAAPVETVWDMALGLETYTQWTAPFMEGSTFKGTWEEGERMHFLAPGGSGMVAVIAENRRHEFISIEHLGFVVDGVEDTTSEAVQSWAPMYENFGFEEIPGGTRVSIEQEVFKGYMGSMKNTWTRALAALQSLCETN